MQNFDRSRALMVMEFIICLAGCQFWLPLFHQVVNLFYKRQSTGILATPKPPGVVIHSPAGTHPRKDYGKLPPPPVHGKGKGKMLVMHPVVSDDSSDDEATIIAPLIPLHFPKHPGYGIEHAGDSVTPLCSAVPEKVPNPSDSLSEAQGISPLAFAVHCLQDIHADENNDTTLLVENGNSGSLGKARAVPA
ncbi:hypothetical protein BVRB_1g001040 [Beta vulgaris subsp. vulgaris]|nr:hypothetical protein BVRB_1g001040 [Beta vulgaris subsp. vulgaris]